MKLLAIAAAGLIALLSQPGLAQGPEAAPSEALIDRFIAALPDQDQLGSEGGEIDAGELDRLSALNPGKEAQVRAVLQANLACTGPAVAAGTRRMLRTVARNIGAGGLHKLIGFYEGPDYAAFGALAERMEGNASPSPEDEAALAKFMDTYPLQSFLDQMNRAGEIIASDQAFMGAAMKCASEQVEALTAAGLKAN